MGFVIRGALVASVLGLALGAARAQPAPEPQGEQLRLADVIAAAVRQSPDLAHAKLDLATARAQLLQAQASGDTHVGGTATGQRLSYPATDPNGQSYQSDYKLDLSARRTLSTGGTLSVDLVDERTAVVGTEAVTNGMLVMFGVPSRYVASMVFGLTQPLLRGAGSTAFAAQRHIAERQRDAAALAQEAKARDLVVSLAQAYWQVAFAWRQLEVRKASLELAQKQLDYTEGLIRAEKTALSEALAVRQVIATRKQDVIAGEQEMYDRSVALRQLAGLEIGPDALAVKTEPLPLKVDPAQLDLRAVVRAAFDHSAELASLVASHKAAQVAVDAADNAARSQLDLGISGGPLGVSPSVTRALYDLVYHTGYQVTGSLTFDHTIEQHAEHGGQQVARAALQQAEVAEREAQARLALRATRAVQRAQAALASIELGDEAIQLAEQNITAEQKRFELGKSTNFEVLRRQDELGQAQLRQASSVNDYLAARADLDGLSGEILARFGIVMP
jgi:outer membrane protein TolC